MMGMLGVFYYAVKHSCNGRRQELAQHWSCLLLELRVVEGLVMKADLFYGTWLPYDCWIVSMK
jgi:hypothetical protein